MLPQKQFETNSFTFNHQGLAIPEEKPYFMKLYFLLPPAHHLLLVALQIAFMEYINLSEEAGYSPTHQNIGFALVLPLSGLDFGKEFIISLQAHRFDKNMALLRSACSELFFFNLTMSWELS